MTAAYKKHRAKKKRKKDIVCLVNLISDMNQKMSHIIDQLRDMYAAIEVIDSFSQYRRD